MLSRGCVCDVYALRFPSYLFYFEYKVVNLARKINSEVNYFSFADYIDLGGAHRETEIERDRERGGGEGDSIAAHTNLFVSFLSILFSTLLFSCLSHSRQSRATQSGIIANVYMC